MNNNNNNNNNLKNKKMIEHTENQNQSTEDVQYAEVIESIPVTPSPVQSVSSAPISMLSATDRAGKPDMSKFTPEQIDRFKQKTAMIKTDDNTSILNFGLDVQNKLSASSSSFLNNVRAFDAGEIGNSITDLLTEINHIEIDDVVILHDRSWTVPLLELFLPWLEKNYYMSVSMDKLFY